MPSASMLAFKVLCKGLRLEIFMGIGKVDQRLPKPRPQASTPFVQGSLSARIWGCRVAGSIWVTNSPL